MTSRRAPRVDTVVDEQPAPRPGAKGRPTRSRKEALAARQRPLVPDDRKEARRRSRAQASSDRARAQRAMITGDEADMPPAHRGADRRYVRDLVDSRRNVAEYLLPVATVLIVLAFVVPLFSPRAYTLISAAMLAVLWGGLLLCVVDAFRIRSFLRSRLSERFGQVTPGLVAYGNTRAVQFRPLRMPKPQVKHGESPRR